ncbi:MAG: DinB family protein [Chloroflexi bacterium]|nr:DinB family protein [Chloroflexota bacterium]
MSDRPTRSAAIERLEHAGRDIHDLGPRVEAGAPWPLADRFGTEPEARWGPPEILAHLAEMLPFWLGEIERIVASARPSPFGRVATDALRLATIERDRSLPPRELFSRIANDLERYERRLPELAEADLAAVGIHPRSGELSVADVLERMVVGHLEEHVVQIREAIG